MPLLITLQVSGTVTEVVFLLHFDSPFSGPMQHYVGFTDDLEQHLEEHRNGTACATTRHALVVVWGKLLVLRGQPLADAG